MIVLLDKLMLALKSLQSLLEQKIAAVSNQIINSDWNQNDESRADFIKNRPIYEKNSHAILMPETQFSNLTHIDNPNVVTQSDVNGTFIDDIRFVDGVQVLFTGTKVKVTFDGVVYECVISSRNWLGNGGLAYYAYGEQDTGEPFLFCLGAVCSLHTRSTDCVVSAEVDITNIKKLDKKYISDELIDDINSAKLVASSKMNIKDPIGTGSFSMNRKPGTIVAFNSHAEGSDTEASGNSSHAEGYNTAASGDYSHAEGSDTEASRNSSHAEGYNTAASGDYSHAEGSSTTASGISSHAEGYNTTASSNYSHTEGSYTTASGNSSHAEGISTTASRNCSHAEGYNTTASGDSSHAEGYNTTASGDCSHAEGSDTEASGNSSHAEGYNTAASGDYSHAEGSSTTASRISSHAEGYNTTASGDYSHTEGYNTTASGNYSHTEGFHTTASSDYSHVQGRYNVEDTKFKYAHIVGNGTSETALSNAHTLDWNGVPWFQGRPQFGGTAQYNGSQTVMANGDKEIILASSTPNSTKKFKITVDDSGILTATEIV